MEAAYEALQAQYQEKCREEAELRAQLQATELDLQHLSIRAEARGVTKSLVPTDLQTGGRGSDLRVFEVQKFLHWVADHVDLQHHTAFDVGYEVAIPGRQVSLGRTVQWRLNLPGDLKLSAPAELHTEVAEAITASKARGPAAEAAAKKLAECWEMIAAEVLPAGAPRAEPAVFLVHQETSQAVVVATWPSATTAPLPSAPADLSRHFAPITGAVPPPAQRGFTAAPPVLPVSVGDRVEVEYKGRWLLGVLQSFLDDGSAANVKCDIDLPGVLTVVPITSVRPIGRRTKPSVARSHSMSALGRDSLRHARAKSQPWLM